MARPGKRARKPAQQRYRTEHRLFRNKLRRVRRSNGEAAARHYEARFRPR